MNRLFLSLLLFSTFALAADRPKGFLNINWGASPEEAKRILQARPGIKFPEETDDYKFELTGGEFAGKPVAKWVLEFPDRKFASAVVILKNEGDAPALYKEFRTNLVAKYGPATSDRKAGPKGPKNRPGGAPPDPSTQSTTTTWKFTPNIKEKSALSIVCEMGGAGGPGGGNGGGPGGAVTVRYINDTLVAASAPKTEAKPAGPVGVKKEDL